MSGRSEPWILGTPLGDYRLVLRERLSTPNPNSEEESTRRILSFARMSLENLCPDAFAAAAELCSDRICSRTARPRGEPPDYALAHRLASELESAVRSGRILVEPVPFSRVRVRRTVVAPPVIQAPPPVAPPPEVSKVDPMKALDQVQQAATQRLAAKDGTPFCEECEKAKQQRQTGVAA